MLLTFERPKGASFEASIGPSVSEDEAGVLHDGRRLHGAPDLPEFFALRRARPGKERLLQLEREACTSLEHPGLPRFYGVATSPEHGIVLALERLAPNPLLLFNAPGVRPSYRDPGTTFYPLPPGRALELAFDLVLALEHLHARGRIHGSVRPSTLLVRAPSVGSDPRKVLADVAEGAFEGVLAGLSSVRTVELVAKIARGEAEASLAPELQPVYAPPEAIVDRRITPACDVYAFGVVLHMLLTGRFPYDEHRRPTELHDRAIVAQLKRREAQGEVSPVALDALAEVPLHDVAFEGRPIEAWPAFHSATRWLVARCVADDPAARPSATDVRGWFESELRLRPSGSSALRPWSQRLFQMRTAANRLTGDLPGTGLAVRVLEDGSVEVEERRAAAEAQPEGRVVAFEGGSLRFGSEEHSAQTNVIGPGKKGVPKEPKGMILLANVLREFRARRPLPIEGPVLVTSTGYGPRELVRSLIFSLGRATARIKIGDDRVQESVHVRIGRGEENDLVLADASVSKQHLVLERSGGGWWLVDLRATNGTFIDGRPVPPGARVRLPGSLATIGLGPDSRLTFMDEAELRNFLGRALDAWAQAFGHLETRKVPRAVARPAPDKATAPLDVQVAFDDEAVGPQLHTSTRKLNREVVKRAKTTSPPPDLEARLKARQAPGARFRILLEGARVEKVGTVEEALEIVRAAPQEVVTILVEHPTGQRIFIYERAE